MIRGKGGLKAESLPLPSTCQPEFPAWKPGGAPRGNGRSLFCSSTWAALNPGYEEQDCGPEPASSRRSGPLATPSPAELQGLGWGGAPPDRPRGTLVPGPQRARSALASPTLLGTTSSIQSLPLGPVFHHFPACGGPLRVGTAGSPQDTGRQDRKRGRAELSTAGTCRCFPMLASSGSHLTPGWGAFQGRQEGCSSAGGALS